MYALTLFFTVLLLFLSITQALKEYSPDEAKVVRASQTVHIHASELVPGDIVTVSVGDKIPADCRLLSISSSSFRVDQAILTGESESVSKTTDVVPDIKAVKQDMTNLLFSVRPRFSPKIINPFTVYHPGDHCRQWQCTGYRGLHWPEDSHRRHPQVNFISNQREDAPQRKLDDFGDMLARIISIICVFVWVINFKNFGDPSHRGVFHGAIHYFETTVALAVAAIPEGLAAVITACLALGTKKWLRRTQS
jgi:Ca2+ transporting ATPase